MDLVAHLSAEGDGAKSVTHSTLATVRMIREIGDGAAI